MSTMQHDGITRRGFLASTGAAAGGLMVGFHVPLAQAADLPPEINAWVVVKPDDTVVIRIARSEMGQGTLTGLAQLVAEDLALRLVNELAGARFDDADGCAADQ